MLLAWQVIKGEGCRKNQVHKNSQQSLDTADIVWLHENSFVNAWNGAKKTERLLCKCLSTFSLRDGSESRSSMIFSSVTSISSMGKKMFLLVAGALQHLSGESVICYLHELQVVLGVSCLRRNDMFLILVWRMRSNLTKPLLLVGGISMVPVWSGAFCSVDIMKFYLNEGWVLARTGPMSLSGCLEFRASAHR